MSDHLGGILARIDQLAASLADGKPTIPGDGRQLRLAAIRREVAQLLDGPTPAHIHLVAFGPASVDLQFPPLATQADLRAWARKLSRAGAALSQCVALTAGDDEIDGRGEDPRLLAEAVAGLTFIGSLAEHMHTEADQRRDTQASDNGSGATP